MFCLQWSHMGEQWDWRDVNSFFLTVFTYPILVYCSDDDRPHAHTKHYEDER